MLLYASGLHYVRPSLRAYLAGAVAFLFLVLLRYDCAKLWGLTALGRDSRGPGLAKQACGQQAAAVSLNILHACTYSESSQWAEVDHAAPVALKTLWQCKAAGLL